MPQPRTGYTSIRKKSLLKLRERNPDFLFSAKVKTKASLETNYNESPKHKKIMKEITTLRNQNPVKYVPAGTGPMYWGPGDKVTFLVTGAQSGGACFILEAMAPPGGGPPPHGTTTKRSPFTFWRERSRSKRPDRRSERCRGILFTSRAARCIRSAMTGRWTPRRSS